MNTTLRVAVLGANGKAGSVIVSALLDNGFRVNALVRNRHSMQMSESESLRVFVGDATNGDELIPAVRDCDCIVNAISNRGNKAPVSARVTETILDFLSTNGTIRYFVVTGKTVKAEHDAFSPVTILQRRMLTLAYPGIVRNKQAEYELLKASGANWTLIRCPLLTDEDRADYRVSERSCGGGSLPKQALASFMLDELRNGEYARKSPFVFRAG